ncbi:MAG: universal stress protein [Lentimicrobiaceae bacterium]|nr:universal stress protein [Lentimicrobiaceae bacterium]
MHILVPYDFDAQTDKALQQAVHLASHSSGSITLLYVFEGQSIISAIFGNDRKKEMFGMLADKLEALAVSLSLKTGIDVNVRLEQGRIGHEIAAVAKDLAVDMIVMGTRSSNFAEDEIPEIGANTSRVIRLASCPVISISGTMHYDGLRMIMLPFDHHPETTQKVDWAIKMAQIYGAGIHLVSALPALASPQEKTEATTHMDKAEIAIKAAGISYFKTHIEPVTGDKTLVNDLLTYAASAGDIDLIVIMTQRGPAFVDFFVDSQAQEFIRRSNIPVMTIVPDKEI